jgi:O-antigen/teichoic acid export membrane protein
MAFGGTVLGNGLTYLFGFIIGRLLGADTVGLYFLAVVLIQLAGSLCRVGLSDGLLRFVAIHAGEGNTSSVRGTILFSVAVTTTASVAVAVLVFALAEAFAIHVFKQPALVPYLRWMALTLPFFTVLMVLLNATQALKRMELVVLSRDFIQPVVMVVVGLALFYSIRDFTAFLAGYFTSMVIACGTAAYFLARACPGLGHPASASFQSWKVLMAFSLPIAGGDVVNYLFRWSDTLLLSFFRSPAEVGVYNAALRTTLLLGLLAVAINALYGPIIADHYHNGRAERIQLILKTLMRWCLTLALPIVLAMCLLADQILSLWGANFSSGSPALVILALGQVLFITSSLLAFTLLMCGRQYLEVGNVLFVTTLNVVANLVAIPRYGITGAAAAMLGSQAVILLVRVAQIRHILGLRLYTPRYLKPLLALVPASFLGVMLRAFLSDTSAFGGSQVPAMLMTVGVITLGYFVALYALGLEEEDVTVWRQVRTSEL